MRSWHQQSAVKMYIFFYLGLPYNSTPNGHMHNTCCLYSILIHIIVIGTRGAGGAIAPPLLPIDNGLSTFDDSGCDTTQA